MNNLELKYKTEFNIHSINNHNQFIPVMLARQRVPRLLKPTQRLAIYKTLKSFQQKIKIPFNIILSNLKNNIKF